MANFRVDYITKIRKMSNILFRADASSSIGTGHIMRDFVLAKQYKKAKIHFATRALKGNINHLIQKEHYTLHTLNSNRATELLKLIKKLKIDLLIIDHYGVDAKFEKKIKKSSPKLTLIVLDDTYEKHHCDILLNHNIYAKKKHYRALVPKRCKLYCGSKYTLLRKEFHREKKKPRKKSTQVKSIFIAMGGADSSSINIKILKTLEHFSSIQVHLVTTRANRNLKKLQDYAKDKKWIRLHIDSTKVARLMRKSDFGIITPSVTANEAYFMKLPFIAIQTAKNQKKMLSFLSNRNYKTLKKFKAQKLKQLLQKMLDIEMINFVDMSAQESAMVLEWRNTQNVRRWMHSSHIITPQEHQQFLSSLAKSQNREYFLLKSADAYLGVIDFVDTFFGLYANPHLSRVGDTLLQTILWYAFACKNLSSIQAEVYTNNTQALKLYKRFHLNRVKQNDAKLIMELKNENS